MSHHSMGRVRCRGVPRGFPGFWRAPRCTASPRRNSGFRRNLTWVKEDDGFEAGVLIVIDLDVPQGLHQLIQDPGGHTSDFQLRAVHWDDEIIPWEDKRNSPSGFGSSSALIQQLPQGGFPGSPSAICSNFQSAALAADAPVRIQPWFSPPAPHLSQLHVSAPTLCTQPAPRSALLCPLSHRASVCKQCCTFIFGFLFLNGVIPLSAH